MDRDALNDLISGISSMVDTILQPGQTEEVIEKMNGKLLGVLTRIPNGIDDNSYFDKINGMAIDLWNQAIVSKYNMQELSTTLRHLSCRLTHAFRGDKCREEAFLKKHISMLYKTAKCWIGCNQLALAEDDLTIAQTTIALLEEIVRMQEDSVYVDKTLIEIRKDSFKINYSKAEIASLQGNFLVANEELQKAVDLLKYFPDKQQYIAMLSFNMGVDAYNKNNYTACLEFLRTSFNLGKGLTDENAEKQARTLRFIATIYNRMGENYNLEEALKAINQANLAHLCLEGLQLKIKILLSFPKVEDHEIKLCLEEIQQNNDLTLTSGLEIINYVKEAKLDKIALSALDKLSNRFEFDKDIGKVWIAILETLIHLKQTDQAKLRVTQYLSEYSRGSTLDKESKARLQSVIWQQASVFIEEDNFKEALDWYDLTNSLYIGGELSNEDMAKLETNRASCLLSLGNLNQAEETLQHALKYDSEHPGIHFLKYKLAILQKKNDIAVQVLEKIGHLCDKSSDGGDVHGYLSLAAKLASESNDQQLSQRTIELLVNQSHNMQQVLTCLKCLTRLQLSHHDDPLKDMSVRSKILEYIKRAHQTLIQTSEHNSILNKISEAEWFMKIAWNMALKSGDNFKEMQQLFELCAKLTELGVTDIDTLGQQKSCLLMCTATSLQISRSTNDKHIQTLESHKALTFIDKCKDIFKEISLLKKDDKEGFDVKSHILLLLYEFEARIILGGGGCELIMDEAIHSSFCNSNVYETLAGLALEHVRSPKNKEMALQALKASIQKYLQMDTVDFTKCSKTIHSLVELAWEVDDGMVPNLHTKAWSMYQDALNIITEHAKGDYPEIEILWLMTKAWNCGIMHNNSNRRNEAVKWCNMAYALLCNMNEYKASYKEKMDDLTTMLQLPIDTTGNFK